MRIFLCGDSFTENLFKTVIDRLENKENVNSQVADYVIYYQKKYGTNPLYFDDHLRLLGHEVINFGQGGCCVYDIFNQFGNLKKYDYREGDRLIINWTNPGRYEWFNDNIHTPKVFTGGIPKDTKEDEMIFFLQTDKRHESFVKSEGKFNKELLPFMDYLIQLHEKYKPIVWCPFHGVSKTTIDLKYYIYSPDDLFFENIIPEFKKLLIYNETDKQINDHHYGKYGNYYLATIFNTILNNTQDSNNGYYIKNIDLVNKIIENIKQIKNNQNNNFLGLYDHIHLILDNRELNS